MDCRVDKPAPDIVVKGLATATESFRGLLNFVSLVKVYDKFPRQHNPAFLQIRRTLPVVMWYCFPIY